jgi:hypothetical protein
MQGDRTTSKRGLFSNRPETAAQKALHAVSLADIVRPLTKRPVRLGFAIDVTLDDESCSLPTPPRVNMPPRNISAPPWPLVHALMTSLPNTTLIPKAVARADFLRLYSQRRILIIAQQLCLASEFASAGH